jgi:hypothetical protein
MDLAGTALAELQAWRGSVPENTPVSTTLVDLAPVDVLADPPIPDRSVEVYETMMTIHELSIERPSILKYLQAIAPEKQAIALVHALEVGVTEMIARRERFKQ